MVSDILKTREWILTIVDQRDKGMITKSELEQELLEILVIFSEHERGIA